MTEEQTNLLLKDLSARIPYNIKAQIPDKYGGYTAVIESVNIDEFVTCSEGNCLELTYIKPYLFPMSSMTEEQREKYESLCETSYSRHYEHGLQYECGPIAYNTKFHDTVESIDYLIENHFDYRGLIPMGLALDATNLNIY